jgi:hypothetical protein
MSLSLYIYKNNRNSGGWGDGENHYNKIYSTGREKMKIRKKEEAVSTLRVSRKIQNLSLGEGEGNGFSTKI